MLRQPPAVAERILDAAATIAPELIGERHGLLGAGIDRALRSQLYGIGSSDPATYVALAAVLLLVAILATYLPARRATRVDPAITLRAE